MDTHAIPDIRLARDHGARHQSAHGMGEQAQRLFGALRLRQSSRDGIGQQLGRFRQRPAPVVRELDDLVRIAEELGQLRIAAADHRIGGYVLGINAQRR